MKIYGVALLALCFLAGQILGTYLGDWLGTGGNVGGVGFGMLFLILLNDRFNLSRHYTTESKDGITFWSAMYIPVVIAMSATLNVKSALTGGGVALFAGIIGTSASMLLIPWLAKKFRTKSN